MRYLSFRVQFLTTLKDVLLISMLYQYNHVLINSFDK
jgi:hypothetical protein